MIEIIPELLVQASKGYIDHVVDETSDKLNKRLDETFDRMHDK